MDETMDEELKILAQQIVKKIDRKIRSTIIKEPYKLAKTIDIGADGTPTKYIDKIAEDVAIKTIKKANIAVNLLSEEVGFIDNNGDYLITIPSGWSGTVTPSKACYTFSPTNRPYTNILADMTGQDYTATATCFLDYLPLIFR